MNLLEQEVSVVNSPLVETVLRAKRGIAMRSAN